jgi:hypothetical protein
MRPLISAILLASASLAVAAPPAQHARNDQGRCRKQYTLVDHYSAEDFMDEK